MTIHFFTILRATLLIAFSFCVIGCDAESAETSLCGDLEKNKALIQRFVEEVQNQQKIELIQDFVAVDFIEFSGIVPLPPGPEGIELFHKQLFASIPDANFVIEDQIAEGNAVMTRKTLSGTHQGVFFNIPPTGKFFSVEIIDIFTINEICQLQTHRTQLDAFSLIRQLGPPVPPEQLLE